jgi:hypothetical protein
MLKRQLPARKAPGVRRKSRRRSNVRGFSLALAVVLIAVVGCTSQPATTPASVPPASTPTSAPATSTPTSAPATSTPTPGYTVAVTNPVPPTPTRTPLPPPISPDFPTGTFYVKHPVTFDVLQFSEDGTWAFFWKVPSADVSSRQPYVRGTYKIDRNLYTETSVTDFWGTPDPDCPWPATYAWTYDGQTLAFQVVGEDRCADRQQTYEDPLLWTKSNATPVNTNAPPTATPAHSVQVTRNVEYTRPLQPGVRAQALDVYAPEEAGPWPVVIFVPGYGANKETMADIVYGKVLAGRGAVVFLPNWRASMARESAQKNGVRWREALEELACAVRFARAGAAEYGGDPGWVTVVGGRSIGESLVQALVGDGSEAWDQFAAGRGGPPAQVECLESEGSPEVDAYVAWAEAPLEMDFLKDQDPELWELCSPLAHFGSNLDLRVRFLRGAQDQRMSLERITAFQQAMKAAGYDVTLTALEEGDDAPPWSGPAQETLVQAILEAARR